MTANRPKATDTIQIDNELCKVTRWDFQPGEETGWRDRNFDYVVIPITDCELREETLDGPITAQLKAGNTYARKAGGEDNFVNAGSTPMTLVELEWKQTP